VQQWKVRDLAVDEEDFRRRLREELMKTADVPADPKQGNAPPDVHPDDAAPTEHPESAEHPEEAPPHPPGRGTPPSRPEEASPHPPGSKTDRKNQ
ncbi:MAG: hypothetical protein ACQETM_02465, partial [Bacteroidota bacterium]